VLDSGQLAVWNEDVTSSTKPEVLNLSQRHQRRTKPCDTGNVRTNLVNFGRVVVFECREQTDRQTDKHTYHSNQWLFNWMLTQERGCERACCVCCTEKFYRRRCFETRLSERWAKFGVHTSPHLIWPHFVWTECAATGVSHGELGRFAVHSPVVVSATNYSALGSDKTRSDGMRWVIWTLLLKFSECDVNKALRLPLRTRPS